MSVKLRTKKTKSGKESLYLDIYYKGTRKYEFLGLSYAKNDKNKKQIKEVAEKIRAKKELELGINAYDLPHNLNGDEDFITYYESKATTGSYKSSLSKFKTFIKEKYNRDFIPFKMVNEKICEEYKNWMLELENFNHNTAWVYIYKLKAVLNKAVKEKLISNNPAKFITIKLDETEKVFLTFDEVKKIKEVEFEFRNIKEAFLFGCFTGLRWSDIDNLTWDKIQNDKLYFKQKKTKGIEYLPLNENALEILEIMRSKNQNTEKVFLLPRDTTTRTKKVNEIVKKAKIEKAVNFHTSRHTFATLCLTYGMDLYTVSKLLGHKSIQHTQIYAKIINQKLEEEVNKFPQIK